MAEQSSPKRKYTVSSLNSTENERVRFTLDHFAENRAFSHLPAHQRNETSLAELRTAYKAYRNNWRGLPEKIIQETRDKGMPAVVNYPPMSVDIETAAICDLACPFCYRQHIATPDRLMKQELFRKIIDQCAEMKVPSIKLNWRGEPLLHPALPEFIAYAKDKGILEVMMNTNAASLTPKKAENIIQAGIDMVIFSFDGGSAETYNKMRPGRFKPNDFAAVHENIKIFAAVRRRLGSAFPRTKIQMIVTEDTAREIDNFYHLFQGIVDDVSTKAYSERGGELTRSDPQIIKAIENHFHEKGEGKVIIDPNKIWISKDEIFYAAGRLPCQQIFQRLVVTYDGRVHMCCYDWGSSHTIGFVSEQAFTHGKADLDEVMEKSKQGIKGYEFLEHLTRIPPIFEPEYKVQTLAEIWHHHHLNKIRALHLSDRIDEIELCRGCNFRDTYSWETIMKNR